MGCLPLASVPSQVEISFIPIMLQVVWGHEAQLSSALSLVNRLMDPDLPLIWPSAPGCLMRTCFFDSSQLICWALCPTDHCFNTSAEGVCLGADGVSEYFFCSHSPRDQGQESKADVVCEGAAELTHPCYPPLFSSPGNLNSCQE